MPLPTSILEKNEALRPSCAALLRHSFTAVNIKSLMRRAFTTLVKHSAACREMIYANGPSASQNRAVSKKEIDAHTVARHMGYFTRGDDAYNTATEVLFEMRNHAQQKEKVYRKGINPLLLIGAEAGVGAGSLK
jgi:hypothetical protein